MKLGPEGEAIEAWGDGDMPEGFGWRGARHQIAQVCNRWRVHTRWWEPGQAVWREYLKGITNTGYLCQVYRDLAGGGWYLARVYD